MAAIKVYPKELARGEPGRHYRLGWVEKEKAGGSLVAPDAPHQYNLPEGMRYESGKGLLPNEAPPAAPGTQPGLPKALKGGKL